ncbi:hydrogenase assembly protein HupF [Candidatus Bathyarchaeota archaeon]|nr:hydrogenase assembly protein HupF [Candidatus Bathyarchaeota archaeon]
MGKLAKKDLEKLLSCIRKDPRVLVPPLPGYDAGVHFMGDKCMVVSTDPCVDVPEEWFGWLLIHYAASDVAVFGAKPEYCTINLLGPASTTPAVFQNVMEQVCGAAEKLGMVVITGHTGVYEGVSQLIGVCTAYGTVAKEKLIMPGNAKAGDLILCTESVGLELLVNFSFMHKALAQRLFGVQRAEELARLVESQSCVNEALQLAELGGVNSMHDATEGGLVAALNEVADASEVGFRVEMEKVPISQEAWTLRDHFKLTLDEVLSMSSTGTILAAVDPQAKSKVEEALRTNGFAASFLGKFTKSKDRVLAKSDGDVAFPQVADDPYSRILSLQF